jgi:hypothetical protein
MKLATGIRDEASKIDRVKRYHTNTIVSIY